MGKKKFLSFTLVSCFKLSDQHVSFSCPQPPEAVVSYPLSQGSSSLYLDNSTKWSWIPIPVFHQVILLPEWWKRKYKKQDRNVKPEISFWIWNHKGKGCRRSPHSLNSLCAGASCEHRVMPVNCWEHKSEMLLLLSIKLREPLRKASAIVPCTSTSRKQH